MDKNEKRRQKYAAMPTDQKEAMLRKQREKRREKSESLKRLKSRSDIAGLGSSDASERIRSRSNIVGPRSNDAAESSGSAYHGSIIMLDFPNRPLTLPSMTTCPHCKALKFYGESIRLCCSGGEIELFLPPASFDVYSLLTGTTEQCMNFRVNIRSYNNNLAFTTLGARYDAALTANRMGVYTFKVQGQVYHFLNPLKSFGLHKAAGVQLYFYDSALEFKERMKWSEGFDEHVLRTLMGAMNNNPYCSFLKQVQSTENLEEKKIILNANPVLDQRRYNKPTVSQVAAVFVDSSD